MADTTATAQVDLDKLKALAKAATPGPWTHESTINGVNPFVYRKNGMRRQIARTLKLSDDADARFIAAMNPAVALALITEVRAHRAALLAIHDLASARLRNAGAHEEPENWDFDMREIERISAPPAVKEPRL